MWVLHILYAISGICVCDSQESSVDSYRDVRGIKIHICVQLCIPFHFVVVPFK